MVEAMSTTGYAYAKSRKEDSDRLDLNPKIDKGDRFIPERSVRSPF
ncbi:hypothetical protein IQ276_029945 [Desmonostoc muscorum LEGE 12446]|nr:hypothetical protein [Desmonostoc muscorum]MCF2150574.1 hypothetical protein [Desmonostoc muscorum LEGE 12446]